METTLQQIGIATEKETNLTELLKDPKVLTGGTIGGAVLLAYLGGPLIVNSLITGVLMFSSISLLLYHTRDDWPALLPWTVRNKSSIDTLFFIGATIAFLSLGVTTSIGLAFTAIFTTIALLILKQRGVGEGVQETIIDKMKNLFTPRKIKPND